jgi:hypothetical protein
LVAILALAVSQWALRNSVRDARQRMAAEQQRLLEEVEKARAALDHADATLAAFRDVARDRYGAADDASLGRLARDLAHPSPTNQAADPPTTPSPPVPKEPAKTPNLLGLESRTTRSVPEGIRGTMRFAPTSTEEPLAMLILVVRIPGDSTARILRLAPKDEATFGDTASTVSEDGAYAAFRGVPGESKSLEFDLTVSGPVVADVRGTCGIEPFEFDMAVPESGEATTTLP